jgi:hypothetical protein
MRHEGAFYRLSPEEQAEWPSPHITAVEMWVGGGKTTRAAEKARGHLTERQGGVAFIAVPRIELGEEIAEQHFRQYGIETVVIRGRKQPDPKTPGKQMCHDLEAVDLALKAGMPIEESCCRGVGANGERRVCPFLGLCGTQRQKKEAKRARIIIGAHQTLFSDSNHLPKITFVVIDETFIGAALMQNASARKIRVADLYHKEKLGKKYRFDISQEIRRRLKTVCEKQIAKGEPGGLSYDLLAKVLSAEDCRDARAAEFGRMERTMWPGMSLEERKAAIPNNALSFTLVFEVLAAFLDKPSGKPNRRSGHLYLTFEDSEWCLRIAWRKPIRKKFQVRTLIIDATMPRLALEPFFPQGIEYLSPGTPKPDAVHIRQLLNAPVSGNKLKTPRNVALIRQTILAEAQKFPGEKVLVIMQLAAEKLLLGQPLPDNIAVRHFGDLTGLDDYGDVRLIVVIGRAAPPPIAMEDLAAVVSGDQPERLVSEGSRSFCWYPARDTAIELADGMGARTYADHHPDPLVETLRWRATEGEVIQAIGRSRPYNRNAGTPLEVLIINDLELGLVVDAVEQWSDAPRLPAIFAAMWERGAILFSAADVMRLYPGLCPSSQAAKKAIARARRELSAPGEQGDISLRSILLRKMSPCAVVHYHPAGHRQKWRKAVVPTDAIEAFRARLEEVFGADTAIEVIAGPISATAGKSG